jgi:hypothetical protein
MHRVPSPKLPQVIIPRGPLEIYRTIHLSIHPVALTAHIGPWPPLMRFRNLTLIDNW